VDGPDADLPVDIPVKVRRRLNPVERYGVRLTVAGLAIALVAIPFSTLTFNVMEDGPLIRWDGDISNAMNRWVHRNDWVIPVLNTVSWLGRPPFLAIWVVATAVWCWRHSRHRLAIFVVATTLMGGIVDTLVKMAVNRPRPEVDHPVTTAFGKSFPSGHAMSSLITYGAICLLLVPAVAPRWRKLLVAATAFLVLLIGASRLLLGVHFLTDVLGGYILGAAWLAAAAAVFEAWRHEVRPSDPDEPDEIAVPHHDEQDQKVATA
jgi:undecaprenyl-diphosphatase